MSEGPAMSGLEYEANNYYQEGPHGSTMSTSMGRLVIVKCNLQKEDGRWPLSPCTAHYGA